MKKIFLASLLTIFTLGIASAQNTASNDKAQAENQNGPKIEFSSTTHDYGDIKKGGDGNCEFTFTNVGNEPLILSNVRASCGCTTPSYTKEPVMPGKTGKIKVRYNTNNLGGFSKRVTVNSNSTTNPTVTLTIKGTVKQ
ncbi:MAG: DUF1573 domain-containing protein [Bacteroidales bacterium]|nr:DUF1573 domain-containing protein [Bacteroidales bacterium]